MPLVGLSMMLESDFRAAALPLLEEGVVDALEWSFDVAWGGGGGEGISPWAAALLDCYADAGRLYGHGVHFSALSARWEPRQEWWLARLSEECRARPYRHVSEHFGFMTARGFDRGAPLPVPRTDGAVRLGRERLARLAEAAKVPIGLENLALAFGPSDASEQGAFLRDLVLPSDGFVLLDVHNLHCQVENFGLDEAALLSSYPLDRVRELHVSGGSFSHGGFRRDTHDGEVPAGALALLGRALDACPNVELVVLERLGGTLASPVEAARFRADYLAVKALVDAR